MHQCMNSSTCAALHAVWAGVAGCDGVVNMWDGENKKRLCQVRHVASAQVILCCCYNVCTGR